LSQPKLVFILWVSLRHYKGPAENRSSMALQALPGQYTDVFTEYFPKGLPPERILQLVELFEVKTQIDELLEKDFIPHQSMGQLHSLYYTKLLWDTYER
jgi:hypothetical protein